MANLISDGSSLSGTTTSQISAGISTNRNCCIEIVNYTDSVLTDPNCYCKSGYCYLPLQPNIQSRTRETCSFSKAAEAPTGSVGVLTYQLDGGIRLAIMFAVPYDYNFYDNWFGLALLDADFPASETLYDQMYNQDGFDNQPDKKRAKAKSGGTLHVERNGWKVSATMSDAKRAIIHVDVNSTFGQSYGGGECRTRLMGNPITTNAASGSKTYLTWLDLDIICFGPCQIAIIFSVSNSRLPAACPTIPN